MTAGLLQGLKPNRSFLPLFLRIVLSLFNLNDLKKAVLIIKLKK